ncbi:hypothetical protein HPP92_005556 [Vanilla planifolia]|uniref:C3H1-type domain-containing protein n=1 Tax=Vanilla planifolia TaxID=51239 RepID=A0A835VCA3_VANPL|nr:hypothetical protein HPP92_005556 [Vanilla planifolia]
MVGEGGNHPIVQVPPWPTLDELVSGVTSNSLAVSCGGDLSPFASGELKAAALQRFLPSNDPESDEVKLFDPPIDAYSCDDFRIYEFKVRRCPRGRSHDWTECPYAHPGEKARRRDPRKYHYLGTSCPDFRKGCCKKGDACEFAHGVFESWLHPSRYRTQPCKDGKACLRRVCFFAHTPEQLRVVPNSSQQQSSPKVANSYDGSPLRLRRSLEGYFSKGLLSSSPTSTLGPPTLSTPSDSPPISPVGLHRVAVPQFEGINEMISALKGIQLNKSSWRMGFAGCGFGSPRGVSSVMSTPTVAVEVPMGARVVLPEVDREERFNAGVGYRGNILTGGESTEDSDAGGGFPDLDVGWVSELVK